jgi:hypothetical protein
MNEAKFRQELKEGLSKNLEGEYIIKENENLIYKVMLTFALFVWFMQHNITL